MDFVSCNKNLLLLLVRIHIRLSVVIMYLLMLTAFYTKYGQNYISIIVNLDYNVSKFLQAFPNPCILGEIPFKFIEHICSCSCSLSAGRYTLYKTKTLARPDCRCKYRQIDKFYLFA